MVYKSNLHTLNYDKFENASIFKLDLGVSMLFLMYFI